MSIDFEYLVMKPVLCQNCNSIKDNKEILLGQQYGIYYCKNDDCVQSTKKGVITYLNNYNIIPLFFYNKKICYFKFYRKSTDTIEDGYINFYESRFEYCLSWNDKINEFCVALNFRKGVFRRFVSLSNIFHFNADFYNMLIKSTNLFMDENICIEYKQLSNDIRNKIKTSYTKSKTKKIFLY